jgi:hypothetical protein
LAARSSATKSSTSSASPAAGSPGARRSGAANGYDRPLARAATHADARRNSGTRMAAACAAAARQPTVCQHALSSSSARADAAASAAAAAAGRGQIWPTAAMSWPHRAHCSSAKTESLPPLSSPITTCLAPSGSAGGDGRQQPQGSGGGAQGKDACAASWRAASAAEHEGHEAGAAGDAGAAPAAAGVLQSLVGCSILGEGKEERRHKRAAGRGYMNEQQCGTF